MPRVLSLIVKRDAVQRCAGGAVLREVCEEAGTALVAGGPRLSRRDRPYRDPLDRVDRQHADRAVQSSASLDRRPLPVAEGDAHGSVDQPHPDALGEEHAETLPAPSARQTATAAVADSPPGAASEPRGLMARANGSLRALTPRLGRS